MKRELEKLRRLGSKRIEIADYLLSKLDKRVKRSEPVLLSSIIKRVLDNLETDNRGKITDSVRNLSSLDNFTKVFDEFSNKFGVKFANEVYDSLSRVSAFNKEYYNEIIDNKPRIEKIDSRVKKFVDAWLGIDKSGGVVKNGYLHKIIESDEVRLEVQNLVVNSIVSKKGWVETKKLIEHKILGDNEKGSNGMLQKYYRGFIYDTFASVDRATSDIYRSELDLVFGIYEGGVIKTTRKFCREHNGKVYHISEIEAFEPKAAIPTDGSYEPFIMLGGYNCRHYINWITEAYALMLRPDAIDFIDE